MWDEPQSSLRASHSKERMAFARLVVAFVNDADIAYLEFDGLAKLIVKI